jgi:hypothetical protein
LQRVHEGHVDDPLTLEPLYLRRPSITKSTRKQPLLGDTAAGIGPDRDSRCREGLPSRLSHASQGIAPTAQQRISHPEARQGIAPMSQQEISHAETSVSAGLHQIEREDSALLH